MDDGEMGLGVVIGMFGGCVITLMICIACSHDYDKEKEEDWQKACVAHGAAEYSATEDGGVEWRWKDER